MLTQAVALTTIWCLLGTVAVLLRGTRVRRSGFLRSAAWLIVVILSGDLWALAIACCETGNLIAFSLVALLAGLVWIRLLPNWNGLGHAAWSMAVLAVVAYLAYSFALTVFAPLHPVGFLLSYGLFALEVLALGLGLTFAFETLDVCTRTRWNRPFGPAPRIPGYVPKVSVHVPAYNEPIEVVAATLRSLAELDYPDFEVLVVDNNTPRESDWRPIEALCRELGPRFTCLHLDRWPGYKSGALNFALAQTAPDAELIAIVDADYQVQPDFLSQTVGYFRDPRVAFLQTPQDYRGFAKSAFLQACYDSYKYFLAIAMPSRNEHNAIIFGGTMGIVRRSALQEIGGWDEWCITEDAEASLRLLQRGYESVYLNRTFGRGIMPLDFEALKKQRFRWCFGGVQILRKHWEALMPWARFVDPANRLTPAQRYYYLVAALQWFNEVVTLAFTALLILSGLLVALGAGAGLRPLHGEITIVPAVFLLLGLWRFLWALRHALNLSWGRALRAMSCFFSLSWVVALACLQGLVQPRGVFLRTPKTTAQLSIVRALQTARWESSLGALSVIVGVVTVAFHPGLGSLILAVLLAWHATLYLAAPAFSLLSTGAGAGPLPARYRGDAAGRFMPEGRAARLALLLVAILALSYAVVRALPGPAATPRYAALQPQVLQPQQLIGAPPAPTETPRPAPTPRASVTPAPPSPRPSTPPAGTPTPGPTVPTSPAPPGSPPPGGTLTPRPAVTPTPAPATSTPPGGTPTPPPAATLPPATTAPPGATPTPRPLPTVVPTHRALPTSVVTRPF